MSKNDSPPDFGPVVCEVSALLLADLSATRTPPYVHAACQQFQRAAIQRRVHKSFNPKEFRKEPSQLLAGLTGNLGNRCRTR